MVTFSFREYGENLGTRPLGKRVREQLLPLIEQNSCVVLDFTGVNVVSNSFADECIAKLLLEMPLAELRSRTTFKGLNPIANDSVLTALLRRHLTIKNKIRIYWWVYDPLCSACRLLCQAEFCF